MVRRMAFVLVAVFVFAVAGLSLDEVIRQKGAELLEAEAALVAAVDVNEKLSLDVAALSSPQRVADLAEERFGMVLAEGGDRVLYVVGSDVSEDNEIVDAESGVLSVLSDLIF